MRKNNKKKGTRTLADWRVLYYSFRGGKLVVNVLSAIVAMALIAYKFYHYFCISQSYAQDDEVMWILIPLFGILVLWFLLTGIECKLEKEYKRALKIAKARRRTSEVTIQDMMDIHEETTLEDVLKEAYKTAPHVSLDEVEKFDD